MQKVTFCHMTLQTIAQEEQEKQHLLFELLERVLNAVGF